MIVAEEFVKTLGAETVPVITGTYFKGGNILLYLMSKNKRLKEDASQRRMEESDEPLIYERLKYSKWYDANPLMCTFDSRVVLKIEKVLKDKYFIFQVSSTVLVISCKNLERFLQCCGCASPQWISTAKLYTRRSK